MIRIYKLTQKTFNRTEITHYKMMAYFPAAVIYASQAVINKADISALIGTDMAADIAWSYREKLDLAVLVNP